MSAEHWPSNVELRKPGVHVPELQVREIPRVSDYASILARGINDLKPSKKGTGSRDAFRLMDRTMIKVGWHNTEKGDHVYGLSVGEGDARHVLVTKREIEKGLGKNTVDATAILLYNMAAARDGGRLSHGLLKDAEKLGVASVTHPIDANQEKRKQVVTFTDPVTEKIIRYVTSEYLPDEAVNDPLALKRFEAKLIADARQLVASNRQVLRGFSDQAIIIDHEQETDIDEKTKRVKVKIRSGFLGNQDGSGSNIDSNGNTGKEMTYTSFDEVPRIVHKPTEKYYTFDHEGEERRGGIKVVTFRPTEDLDNPFDSDPDHESFVFVGGFLANDIDSHKLYGELCQAMANRRRKNVRFVEFVRDDTPRVGDGSAPGWKREHPIRSFTSRAEKRIDQLDDEKFKQKVKSKRKLEVNRISDMIDALREEGVSGVSLFGHSLGGLGAEFGKALADKVEPGLIDLAFGEATVGHNKRDKVSGWLLGLFAALEVGVNPLIDAFRHPIRVARHAAIAGRTLYRGPLRRIEEVRYLRNTKLTPDETNLDGIHQQNKDHVFGPKRIDPAFSDKEGYVSVGPGKHNEAIIGGPDATADALFKLERKAREQLQASRESIPV